MTLSSSVPASWCRLIPPPLLPSSLAPHGPRNSCAMVRIKICGITNSADALAAVEAGANLLGFNFYEKSPRFISESEAEKIRRQLPKKVEAVGIFVNASPADVTAVRNSVKLDAAQLHGDESPEIAVEI